MRAAPLHTDATTLRRARRTQAERSEASRRRLLDAAFELLSERGSTLFTLAEVGERAGYSRGLPSQVFGTKAALLQQLVPHLRAQAQGGVRGEQRKESRPPAGGGRRRHATHHEGARTPSSGSAGVLP